MTDRPIIHGYEIAGRMPPFRPGLRQAIREDRKTMTRRVMKLQPPTSIRPSLILEGHRLVAMWPGESEFDAYICHCPYGLPGQYRVMTEPLERGRDGQAYYRDDHAPVVNAFTGEPLAWIWSKDILTSIHMPYSAARTITQLREIRTELLQEITAYDALLEGINLPVPPNCEMADPPDGFQTWSQKKKAAYIEDLARTTYFARCADADNHIAAFRKLWNTINAKKHPWESNPRVWVIPFKGIA